jgi:hypothetical protein
MENMIEQLFATGRQVGLPDNSDLPITPGTPYKGVVRAQDFITGDALATAINLTGGTSVNSDAGWLHYIETNGLEFLIAKKPLRQNITREAIDTAQAQGNKEVTIGGVIYVVKFMKGMKGSGLSIDDVNAGGDWNSYIYPLYAGADRDQLPVATPVWAQYTGPMLGIYPDRMSQASAAHSIMGEVASNGGYATRGMAWTNSTVTNVMGLWYMVANTPQVFYGWRPMLVRKDTIPIVVTPFKGEVTAANFITSSALATAVGVTTGTLYNDTTPWLKFVDNGKTFYISKKPIRTAITHEQLEALGAVHGSKTVVIGGLTYKVRLMTGLTTDPGNVAGGEYDTYFSRISVNYNGAPEDRWANYTNTDLGYTAGTTGGALSLIQEYNSSYSGWATRGYPGWYGVWYQIANTTHDGYGWRPVLELVP